jgi:D-glycero-alpha-D-manno-heptose-7-phosphate kinase
MMSLSVKRILEQHPVEASAPCRIDSGGTWDIKTLALPLERIQPVTINMALDLRTRVVLSPYVNGRVKVSSEGFSREEEYPGSSLPFNTPFGLFFAAVAYFGFHGLEIRISSDSPVKSALGGSSTALVALIKALSRVTRIPGRKEMSPGEILHLGYHLEDGVSPGKCGIQDQAAAVYGGVSRWNWCYGQRGVPFKRESLLNRRGQKELTNRILVAYSGRSHVSSRINRAWVRGFLSGETRSGWMKANEIVSRLAQAIRDEEWNRAARLLRDEMIVRREITPDALIPITAELIDQAERAGCGARFTGAGGGGSVWALGEKERVRHLRAVWERTLAPLKGARILVCAIEPNGVR